ncbi:MAG: hypothetical protein AVDCRST_MAG65-1992, partial [uncultured Solirubrobacteraceae bacterium]
WYQPPERPPSRSESRHGRARGGIEPFSRRARRRRRAAR